ncbi:unnamed protein product [Fusarium venenatum]|uniref:Uncharacterized protein n=2 Tax=Fusarium venenatum TaxID=56646 RepID=A0A2L2SSV0_9HYPO|nr:uncharacterized protein FVRRES_04708 [Fusarium venenatum]CEI60272.1 unnamed protein product [Fusarium venenatum]
MDLKTYQQLYIYFIPIVTNFDFIDIIVVVVRLDWFKRHLKGLGKKSARLPLTPDSMISFRDAKWPIILMSFLAFARNTLYLVFLRLVIWTMCKILPKHSSTQEPLAFLLNYLRRCYTLLFPSKPTWVLFGIILALNFIDTLLIIVLDVSNPEVVSLLLDARIPAAIFQAASARHTGTAIFNLANINPAV